MIRAFLLTILLSSFLAVLVSCGKSGGKNEHSAVDVGALSTDIHVSIAQHTLIFPLIALEDYAYREKSFSFDQKGDRERALDALNQLLRNSADPKKPLVLDDLSVVVRTYGWNDFDARQIQLCPLLTREWARSVCDNPWAAIQQALPYDSFRLVDLHRLQVEDPRDPVNCRDNGKLSKSLPQRPGETTMVSAMVCDGRDDFGYYKTVIRIDGDLGALWRISRRVQAETAEAMMEREGKAIAAFVQYALGKNEDFSELHAAMCRLRRPGSVDGPHGADCGINN
jgi:hypothetical protein